MTMLNGRGVDTDAALSLVLILVLFYTYKATCLTYVVTMYLNRSIMTNGYTANIFFNKIITKFYLFSKLLKKNSYIDIYCMY